jgi:hypothetical protein
MCFLWEEKPCLRKVLEATKDINATSFIYFIEDEEGRLSETLCVTLYIFVFPLNVSINNEI